MAGGFSGSAVLTREQMAEVMRGAELLHDEQAVDAAIRRMAGEIDGQLGDTLPVVLGVMVGALVPLGRLLPLLHFDLELDYVHATRYRRGTRGSELVWLARPQTALRDRTVLVVDDILDEGHTLAGIVEDCFHQGARDVYTAVLVDKHHGRRADDLEASFRGLDVDDRYVFGAGMDYRGYFRNVGGIYAVSPEHED